MVTFGPITVIGQNDPNRSNCFTSRPPDSQSDATMAMLQNRTQNVKISEATDKSRQNK